MKGPAWKKAWVDSSRITDNKAYNVAYTMTHTLIVVIAGWKVQRKKRRGWTLAASWEKLVFMWLFGLGLAKYRETAINKSLQPCEISHAKPAMYSQPCKFSHATLFCTHLQVPGNINLLFAFGMLLRTQHTQYFATAKSYCQMTKTSCGMAIANSFWGPSIPTSTAFSLVWTAYMHSRSRKATTDIHVSYILPHPHLPAPYGNSEDGNAVTLILQHSSN